MNTLTIENGQFVLRSGHRYRDWASKVLGMRYDFRNDCYTGPATWATYVSVTGLFGQYLETTADVVLWENRAQRFVDDIIESKNDMSLPENVSPLPAMGEYTLFDYQQVDAWLLSQMGSALVTSEMRTGKSGTVLGALRRLNMLTNVLIVCTNGNRYTWQEEIEKWLPSSSVTVVGGTAAQRKKQLAADTDFTIIHYDLLPKHSKQKNFGSMTLSAAHKEAKELNGRFDAVILDEAHFIKDPKAQRTRAAWALGDDAKVRYALTGTPIANNPIDLWALLRFLYPTEFTSRNDFTDRYALMAMNVFGGMDCFGLNPANTDEFYRLFNPKYIRRLRKDVLPFLPEKSYSTVWVDMEPKQRKAYDQMEKSMITVVDDKVLIATDPLTKDARLSQMAAATPVVGTTAEGKSTVEALVLPSAKIDWLLGFLDADDEQVIVFMQSRKLLDLCADVLTEKGVTFCEFKGGMGDKVREDGRRAFQAGQVRVCLFLYDASPEGLDFSNCWRHVNLQPTPKMTKRLQGEDRSFGPAQVAEKIEIIDVITRGTREEEKHRSEIAKEVQLHELVRDEGWKPREIAS